MVARSSVLAASFAVGFFGVGSLQAVAVTTSTLRASAEPQTSIVTVLQVQPAQGPTQRNLFGVNWEGAAFGWTFRNGSDPHARLLDWVVRESPYSSPKLHAALRLLRVRSLRFPGGTPSNYYNWQNASFTPPEHCNLQLRPGACDTYWESQLTANQLLPRRALSWQNFSALLDAINASAVWSLDVVNQSPAETAVAARQLLETLGDRLVHIELGNEVYDGLGKAGSQFPSLRAYTSHISPSLRLAQALGGRFAVPAPPCPSFYNTLCWGMPHSNAWLLGWYTNLSVASKASGPDDFGSWQTVTAHHYRPRPASVDCVAAGFDNCSYLSNAQAYGGIIGRNNVSSSARSGVTSFERPNRELYASTMLSFPQVTLDKAVRAWRRDFPHRDLLISEFNADYAATWSPAQNGGGGDGDQPGTAGAFMRDTANGGAHALHWAAGVLAGINSDGVITGINYHSLNGAASGGQQGFGILDVGGWGVNETGSEDSVWISGVAQLMAHLSGLGTSNPATTMHAVKIGVGGATLGELVVDGVGQLPALQAAAFVTPVGGTNNKGAACQLTLVLMNRAQDAVPVEFNVSAIACFVGMRRDFVSRDVSVRATSYSGLDRGGWQRLSLSKIGTNLPLPGPMKPRVNHTKLALRGSMLVGGEIAALSMQIVEVQNP